MNDETGRHSIEAGYRRGIFWRPGKRTDYLLCIQAFAAGPIEAFGPLPDLTDLYSRVHG